MGDRRCCCPGECDVFTDSFSRADSTDLGDDWYEVTGDWGILGGYLVEKYGTSVGTTDACIICTDPVPYNSKGEMLISVVVPVVSLSDGDVYYIYPACTATSKGIITVSFTWNAITSKWTTSIDGYDTYTTPSTGSPSSYTLSVCCDKQIRMVKAWVSPTVNEYAAWAEDVDPGDGRYAGIGHNNAAKLNKFDDFSLEELRISTRVCIPCFCHCELFPMPKTLRATIIAEETVGGWLNRAYCLNGQYWDMNFFQPPQAVTWTGTTTIDGEELDWELVCGGDQPGNFSLKWTQCGKSGHNCSTLGTGATCAQTPESADISSTCDPLRLLFSPDPSGYQLNYLFDCDLCFSKMDPGACIYPVGHPLYNQDNCVGYFDIEITEVP